MFYLYNLYLFMHTGVQRYFHIRWYSCRLEQWSRNYLPFQSTCGHPCFCGFVLLNSI